MSGAKCDFYVPKLLQFSDMVKIFMYFLAFRVKYYEDMSRDLNRLRL